MTDEETARLPEITVQELKKKLDAKEDFQFIDVREPHEVDICQLGAKLIPIGEFESRYTELSKDKELIIHCRSGVRSGNAVLFLKTKGYTKAYNLAGGILAWADLIDPTMKKY